MGTLSASEVRIPPATFNAVVFNGERVRVQRRDGAKVVILSEEDAAFLEAIEDRYWGKVGEKALAEAKTAEEKPVPWAKVKKELGL
jgi:hypothetical protein